MNLQELVPVTPNPRVQDFRPGDTVRVSLRVKEGDRERVQHFEGVVIQRRGGGPGATFMVRRVSHGVGVERIFPLHSPLIQQVEVLQQGDVARARLYYLRGLSGKAARIRQKGRATPPAAPARDAE
ncbi:MAG: 50S ribosomal protein L19 [Chloroflexi bacterium]|nr:50S ribosomal protein L19 [Chloroflexota bacterium]